MLVIAIVSAAASGGGRELLPREQAVAFPVSPTTDHLGALLMAPLNIAWLLQGWTMLGATSYAVGPGPLVPALLRCSLAGHRDRGRPGAGLGRRVAYAAGRAASSSSGCAGVVVGGVASRR